MNRFSNCCGVDIGPRLDQGICPQCMERCGVECYLDAHPLPLTYSKTDRNQADGPQDDPWGAILIDDVSEPVALVSTEEAAIQIIAAVHAVAASGGWVKP